MTYYFGHWPIMEYVLRTNGLRTTYLAMPTTSVRRCMSNYHVNATIASEITSSHSFKVMDVEEPELKLAIVGSLWSLLQDERQRRHVARLRPARNIFRVPFRRGDNLGGGW